MRKIDDGIILIAKQSGISSFSSLWQIKNALGTKKIGHTGTLDTFAEGLLVALSGKLTHLAPYITDGSKEYLASVVFGSETDTLDPDGTVIKTAPRPFFTDVKKALPLLTGIIQQKPPSYSALHVDGQRASDRVRKGEELDMPARQVTVHSISVITIVAEDGIDPVDASRIARIDLRIHCSKGTYIRSIARDLAYAAGSAAYLGNLRRTKIGPFSLEEAAGKDMLGPFALTKPAQFGVGDRPPLIPSGEILDKVQRFDRTIAGYTGIPFVELQDIKMKAFSHGQKPEYCWFTPESENELRSCGEGMKRSVFSGDTFLGVISTGIASPRYDFVTGAGL